MSGKKTNFASRLRWRKEILEQNKMNINKKKSNIMAVGKEKSELK